MKVYLFILVITIVQATASVYSQTTRLNIKMENATISEVFDAIEKQSDFFFFYNKAQINDQQKVSIDLKNSIIDEVLTTVFGENTVSYEIIGKNIIVKPINILDATSGQQASKKVTGKITDQSGGSLPGVSVVVKGTTTGIVTDNNGNFTLANIPDNATIQFSFVGMKTQEINIGSKTSINVTMEDETIGIDEVVAIGYGTQKKRDIIGSISTIKTSTLESSKGSSNFNSVLQGQAAGVSVQSSSGRLGANVDIKIRGVSSISAGTSPLWIIDGVPIITDVNIESNGSAAQSPMSLINQSDIESIQVLKDAAATSIYGSRGSNGVIMVTTKAGVTGRVSLNVDYSTGISDLPSNRPQFMATKQWFQVKDEAKQAYGLGAYNMSDAYSKKPYSTEFLTREQAEGINTDWRKATMRKGSFQNINFSAMGGDKIIRYYLSGNYRNDKSVMNNEDLERYGIRANIDLKPTNSLEFGTKINLSLSKGNRGKNNNNGVEDGNKSGTAGGFSFVNSASWPFEPVYSLADPKKYYNPYSANAVASSDPANIVEDLDMYRALVSAYAEYHIPFVKGLSARTEVSIDFIQANRNFWVSDAIRYNGSFAQDNASTTQTINYNLFLKYSKNIGDHTLDLVGGTESQRGKSWYRRMAGQNLIGSYQQLGTPSQLTDMFSGLAGEGYLKSYFGRANYKFKDKYLAGFSMRRDGSSVFTSDFRWGNFVALSAGWIISEESFMGQFGKRNFLKFRGSFGQTGNASIPGNLDVTNYTGTSSSYSALSYGSQDILALNGTLVSTIGVNNLRWESTNNMDLGFDFGFINHRIDGSIAYYNKYVKGLLLASSLPPSSGVSSIWGNIGDLVNSGIELSVTTSNLESHNFKWSTTLNIAYNHNEVKKLTAQVDKSGTGMVSSPFISKVGYGIRDFYLADFAFIDPQTGLGQIYARDQEYYAKTGETRRMKDAQGKDVLLLNNNTNNSTNYFHMKGKNTMPTYYGGITNKFTYKAFDLSILITFSGGNYILDPFLRSLENPNANGEMLADFAQNYWKKPGDVAKYQRLDWLGNIKMDDGTVIGLGDNRVWNDQFLFKGDFVKLKSINFGYTLPSSETKKKFFNNIRVYASIENIYTHSEYPGYDPEGQGLISQWDLPQLFSASLGVSVKF